MMIHENHAGLISITNVAGGEKLISDIESQPIEGNFFSACPQLTLTIANLIIYLLPFYHYPNRRHGKLFI